MPGKITAKLEKGQATFDFAGDIDEVDIHLLKVEIGYAWMGWLSKKNEAKYAAERAAEAAAELKRKNDEQAKQNSQSGGVQSAVGGTKPDQGEGKSAPAIVPAS